MQRYYVDTKSIDLSKMIVSINTEDSFHITKVMRMKIGDEIIICDNQNTYLSRIIDMTTCVTVSLIKKLESNSELSINITIAHGLVRREKLEETIQKITQLGAYAYLPVIMEYSNVKINDEKSEKRHERLQKIAKEASEQAHRDHLLIVKPITTWQIFLDQLKNYDYVIYASTKDNIDRLSLRNVLKKIKSDKNNNILFLVGPEGGISKNEIIDLENKNAIPITLGKRILRTETAPLYIMSVIGYTFELEE